MVETQIRFRGQTIYFNKEATRLEGIWLDSHLNFAAHINERVRKAKATGARIKGLSKAYGLCPALVRKIQIAAVQSVTL